MKRFLKILSVFLVVVVVLVLLLSFVVKSYLTEDRIKPFVIKKAEENLHRKVEIGNITVGLFKGIVLNNLSIKEADGKTDFIKVKGFVLKYELLPLLSKRIVIKKIVIDEPYIRICRNKNGKFNYQSLIQSRVHHGKTEKRGVKTSKSSFVVDIDEVKVRKARILFKDELKQLPDADALVDAALSINIPVSGSPVVEGKASYEVTVKYASSSVISRGKVELNPQVVKLVSDVLFAGDSVKIDGIFKNYMSSPDITLNIHSHALHLDKFMALIPKKKSYSGKRYRDSKKVSSKKADSFRKMKLVGRIEVRNLYYKGIKAQKMLVPVILKNSVLEVKDFSVQFAGGTVKGSFTDNLLNKFFKGSVNIDGLKAEEVFKMLKKPVLLSGALKLKTDFSGAGDTLDRIKRTLTSNGVFELTDGKIMGIEVLKSISALIGLPELKNITYEDIRGNFRVKNGNVLLKAALNGDDIKLFSQGTIGFDGRLNLPVELKLSPELSSKLERRLRVVKYLKREEGWLVVPLKLTGTLNNPTPVIQTSFIEERIEEKLLKGLQELFR